MNLEVLTSLVKSIDSASFEERDLLLQLLYESMYPDPTGQKC